MYSTGLVSVSEHSQRASWGSAIPAESCLVEEQEREGEAAGGPLTQGNASRSAAVGLFRGSRGPEKGDIMIYVVVTFISGSQPTCI